MSSHKGYKEKYNLRVSHELDVVFTKNLELGLTHDVELEEELDCIIGALQSLSSTKTRHKLVRTTFYTRFSSKVITFCGAGT